MSRRQQFEQELKTKLEQKRSVHSGAEQTLMKAFKYFDLDNSGQVDLQEFIKTVEKLGVVVSSLSEIEDIYRQYDTSGDGLLDYQEFASILFGNQSATTKQLIQQKPVSQEGFFVEKALENFRNKIASRGARGMIGLQRSFKIMDDNDSKSLDIQEFTKAVKDYRIDVPERDINLLFNAFDVDKNGNLSYDEFLRAVRGPMNAFRKSLVNQAFNKLDKDRSGLIDIDDVRGVYNARDHPDVKSGKKTEDQILQEFLETFEMHHNIAGGIQGDHIITKEEFEEYYNNISASIDNDQYFELMINNTWKLTETGPTKKGEIVEAQSMREAFGKQPVIAEAKGGKKQLPQKAQELEKASSVEELLEKFRQRLAARGARGMLGLCRSFKIMDDNNSQSLDKNEFIKAIRDYRVDISQSDLGKLFDAFDRDGSGELSYDEFLRSVRGPMNNFRKALVSKAFKKLDKDGSGMIDINDIKGVYNAKNHPDVKSGKKTEDDILGDFLETFEMHHNISDKARNDHIVTQEEFEEYYNNVSMSIDDDKYFELMMTNTWKLSGQEEVKKAWAGQVGGKEPVVGRAAWAADHHKQPPYGTTQTPVEYSTSLNPQQGTGRPQTKQQAQKNIPKGSTEELVEKFRQALLSRGARGIIGLQRSFKIMDDNNNKTLELSEFTKAIKDFRVDIADSDIAKVFQAFDRDGSGSVDYDELLRQIRGPMNSVRVNLCQRAFQKIDKSGDGVLELSDLKGVYNAKNHPDVKAGKKTEDDILCEFLDTFELHHSLATGGTGRDSRVTIEEWMEYYNNVSCSIDDDRYFELMMNNAWNLDNKAPVQKAWGGEVGSQPATKKRYI